MNDPRLKLGSLAACLALTACAHRIEPATPPAPIRPPPIICAAIPPKPKPQGAVIRPITEAEIAGFDRLVDYEVDLNLYADAGWSRAKTARDTYCR